MSNSLRPWAFGPFELLLHAETHLRNGEDFDRRIALISFDNAIEVAITTYLSLNPIHRQNRTYQRAQVEQWLHDYHTKIDFFIHEVQQRALTIECEKADFVWYHDVRNDQYHGGRAAIPQARELEGIRKATLWVFSVLFNVTDTEQVIESHITQRLSQNLPDKTDEYDKLIDDTHGLCEICGELYYTSEVLYEIDPVAYSEEGLRLKSQINQPDAAEVEE
ncbi:MAG: hypothetical protein H8D74_01830 [Chloroflexi bacterium]|nr:hypothetical protein [Chloroflexota bacterium]